MGLKSLDHLQRKVEKLQVVVSDLKLKKKSLERKTRDADPAIAQTRALRRSLFGRLALHFAKQQKNSKPG